VDDLIYIPKRGIGGYQGENKAKSPFYEDLPMIEQIKYNLPEILKDCSDNNIAVSF